jgi:aryl-alcohol dehydrogenase-like predicted oxidoreductase
LRQKTIGRSDLRVSVVGLGGTSLGDRAFEESRAIIHRALDAGITLFDTADIYGHGASEEHIGRVLGPRRKDVVIASKFGMRLDSKAGAKDNSPAYILSAVEASLRRLNTDCIDLYQLHRPDGTTHIEDVLRTLERLVEQGKIRYYGCSNLPAWRVVEAQWTAMHFGWHGFVSCQDEYNLAMRRTELELIPAMRAYGMGLLPYYPLASGLLTGKYRPDAPPQPGAKLSRPSKLADRYLNPAKMAMAEELRAFAEARGHSLLELAFSWIAAQPVVASVIAGASRPEQVALNAAAADWILSDDEMAEIDRITDGDLVASRPWGGHAAHPAPPKRSEPGPA